MRLVDTTVFLGITLDSKIQWGPHIDRLSSRLSSAAYAVMKIRRLTDIDTARLKRAIRAIYNLRIRDSLREKFKEIDIMTVASQYIYENLIYSLKGTTTGEDILNEFQKVFTSFALPWSKLVGVCTDGAPSMISLRQGFIGILNEKATELNLQKGLNLRQIKAFLDEISDEYDDVIFYSEVRWLINKKKDFMQIKDKPLSEFDLEYPKWKCGLAYLVDLTGYLNDLNLKLQKQGHYHFIILSACENIAYAQYAEELKVLSEQFSNRFSDFRNMGVCFNLFATPTKSNVQNAPIHLQMKLIEIQENSLQTSKFEDVELFLFTDESNNNLELFLRLCISGINPNIDGLVSQVQAQVSH
ncbi:unnamed protein product [Diatraea saccharalis]|uniref:DUF4371 domain-containing protein n=1 Tax=Diatraea saccharalis TaxID=40085 RepID=A0A9N9RBI3_9NEOP|nr:unnamed protein product [Diatraea saccharalis]